MPSAFLGKCNFFSGHFDNKDFELNVCSFRTFYDYKVSKV